jgi:hypothetical protein
MYFKPEAQTLFMILGSNAPENESDLQMQKRTWLRDLLPSQGYLVLRGLPSASPTLVGTDLHLPVTESYDNILLKTILGMKWALENSNFDILIRTNVSTYFPPSKVEVITRSIDKTKLFFGGYVDQCRLPGENRMATVEYVAGTALILTRPTVQMLCDIDWYLYSKLPDDLAISIALRDAGILPTRFRRNNLSQLHIFIPALQIRLKTSSVPKLASLRMENINRFYRASSVVSKLRWYLVIAVNELRFVFVNWGEFSGFVMQAGAQSRRLFLRIVRQGK